MKKIKQNKTQVLKRVILCTAMIVCCALSLNAQSPCTVTLNDAFTDDIWYFGGYKPNYWDYDTPDLSATSPGIVFKKIL